MTDTDMDDSKRRAFSPPPARRRPSRQVPRPQVNLWQFRHGFGIGLARAGCAVGFGFVPGLAARFGDSALALVCVALAVVVAAAVFLLQRMGRPVEWMLLADAVTLLVLVPVLATASGIEVSDARFGGRSLNFFAAAMAVLLLYVIVTTIATRGGAERNSRGQVGTLPAAMSIAIILLGTAHFSAGAMWRGLSIAWMTAAVITVLVAVTPGRYRLIVSPLAFALFTAGVVVPDILSEGGAPISTGSSAIAVLATVAVAVVLLLIPVARSQQGSEPLQD